LQGRRGDWRNSLGRDVDRSAIDSFRTERSDSCDYDVVSSKRLRYVRQAEALLSIIPSTSRKRTERSRDVIISWDSSSRCDTQYTGTMGRGI